MRQGSGQTSLHAESTPDLLKRIVALGHIELIITDKNIPGLPETTPQVLVEDLVLGSPEPCRYAYDKEHIAQTTVGSGTTGRQKLIPTIFRNLEYKVTREQEVFPMAAYDRLLSMSPMSFQTTKMAALRCIINGATMVFRTSPDLNLLQFCQVMNVTHLFLVVTHAQGILDNIADRDIAQPRLPQLKSLQITSSPITEKMRRKLKSFLSPNLLVRYSTNETGRLTWADPAMQEKYPNCVGIPFKGVSVEVVDDNDEPCAAGVRGNIRVKAAGMFANYLGDDQETERAFRSGWYYPGDVGEINEDGVLIFHGRADDMIIYNGINIYPREIEYILELHPDVKEAAGFQFNANDGRELPGAAVTLNRETNPNALMRFCRQKLGVASPQVIMLIKGDFPRNKAGKVLKRELRARAEQRVASHQQA